MKHLKNVKRAHESIEFQIQQWCLISSFYKSSSLISGRCFDPCLVFENVRPVDFIERTHIEVCQQLIIKTPRLISDQSISHRSKYQKKTAILLLGPVERDSNSAVV